MEIKLQDGQYISSHIQGGVETVSGLEEMIQRILLKLTARRGSFLPMPQFGSRLHTLCHVRPGQRRAIAEQYVKEALWDETDLEIEDVSLVYPDGESAELTIQLNLQGTLFSVTTNI